MLWNLRNVFSPAVCSLFTQPKQPYRALVNITARINIYNNNLKRAID